jgi:hypothetical protein
MDLTLPWAVFISGVSRLSKHGFRRNDENAGKLGMFAPPMAHDVVGAATAPAAARDETSAAERAARGASMTAMEEGHRLMVTALPMVMPAGEEVASDTACAKKRQICIQGSGIPSPRKTKRRKQNEHLLLKQRYERVER